MTILWFEIDLSQRIEISHKFDSVPLHNLALPTRALNALLRHNPRMTVGDLLRADKSILEIKWLSPKSIEHLNERVSILLEDIDSHAEKWFSKPAVVNEDLSPKGLSDGNCSRL